MAFYCTCGVVFEVDIADPLLVHIAHRIHHLEELMTESNAAQAAVDADVASLAASESSLASSFAEALAELKAANPGVDTTKLDAIAAQLATDATSDAAAVAPPAPAPAPEPAPAPVDGIGDGSAPATP